jgi:hypothetical protein
LCFSSEGKRLVKRDGHAQGPRALAWGAAFLLRNGTLAAQQGHVGLTSDDMFPQGMDALNNDDIARLHGQIILWLEYWSAKYPLDTLEQAMLNLLGRLFKIKAAWVVSTRTGPFPFDHAMEEVRTDRFEVLMGGAKV